MANIALQNGKVILKGGLVSCGCCTPPPVCTTDYQYYYEAHGWNECPYALGQPCYPPGSGSCAGLTITGELISIDFPKGCITNKQPRADVYADFDDFGYIGSLSCNKTANCQGCGVQGTIIPSIEYVGTDKIRLKVPFQSTNAYWGGPYGISCNASFYFI